MNLTGFVMNAMRAFRFLFQANAQTEKITTQK